MTKAFDRIKAGLEAAISYANGDETQAVLHTPEQILARKKARQKQRAGLKIVSNKTDGER